MRLVVRYSLFLFILIAFAACRSKDKPVLTIAVASNTQFAMKELANVFAEETGINCRIVISSSGKLTAQIKEGAPFDIFVSADMKYPSTLFEAGLTTAKPNIYAYGSLVLWTLDDIEFLSMNALLREDIKHIALPNPETAPYGLAAKQALEYYGLYTEVEPKFVHGESVAQSNRFVMTQAVQVGFTAQSVVCSPQMKDKGHWRKIEAQAYSPIAQGVVILKKRPLLRKQAEKFYDFLFSHKAKKILDNFGYTEQHE